MTTGFEVWTIDLKAGGKASYSWGPDTPGGSVVPGKWRAQNDVVIITLNGKVRGASVFHVWRFVPINWGERHYLIFEEEVRDFAGMALKWTDEHKDVRSQAAEMYRGPLARLINGKLPSRSGTPHAPGSYADWFKW